MSLSEIWFICIDPPPPCWLWLRTKLSQKQNEVVPLKTDKPIVLYFWVNSCAVCYETFPKYDQLNQKYQNVSDFYLINFVETSEASETERYKQTAVSRLKEKDIYTTSLFNVKSNRKTLQNYQVYAFPTILIIKDNRIVYVGNTLNLERAIEKL